MLVSATEKLYQLLRIGAQGRLCISRSCTTKKYLSKQFEEITIKVPWGHVAGKWYGPKYSRPIVGLHGWQDNAGTFDTLAPLLPSYISFLSIDLPGHGLSSWLPDGISYHSFDYVLLLRHIMDEFKWDKISLIAHSMSAINAFIFSALFPDKIDLNISLDAIKPLHRSPHKIVDYTGKRMEEFLKHGRRVREKTVPPSYNYDEIIERMYMGASKSVSKECCSYLLTRNSKTSELDPKKYYFTRDNRVKYSVFYSFAEDVPKEMATRIKCPHLFIKASKSPYFEDKKYSEEIIDILKQKPNFEYHTVEGTHHVHLNDPEKISNIINPFINKYKP